MLPTSAIFIIDLIFSLAPTYHFSAPSAWQSLQDLGQLDRAYVALVSAGLAAVAAIIGVMVSRIAAIGSAGAWPRARTGSFALTLMLISVGAVLLDHPFLASDQADVRATATNHAGSAVNNLALAWRTTKAGAVSVPEKGHAQTVSASEQIKQDPSTIVLIVVESLGLPVAPDLAAFQLQPLVQLEAVPGVTVSQGSTPFHGSTVAAEMRELCQLRTAALHPEATAIAPNCLPRMLRANGYHGTAIHGFSGSMFSRNRWYRQLGFDDIHFAAGILGRHVQATRCGLAFSGVCDHDAWDFLVDQVLESGHERQFIYWLTLSAHLPLVAGEAVAGQAARECAAQPGLQVDTPVCLLIHQHRTLFARIATAVASGRFRDTLFIVVGDHAPPFVRQRYRLAFSATHVPYLVIHVAPEPAAHDKPADAP